ncbi:MAG: nucleotidyltransferase family protein [Phycisphaeraceae bacterium]
MADRMPSIGFARTGAGLVTALNRPVTRPTRIDVGSARAMTTAARNIWMMHLLERIVRRFNEAGIAVMALKGAALNQTLYERPDERPMSDLDLLIHPEHLDQAHALLERAGCLRSQVLVREDFFPQYYYEIEYRGGQIQPVTIDLHVRPFRPLRYSRFVPDDALWARAEPVKLGRAEVFLPSPTDMLIHLAAHSSIHGNGQTRWLEDIRRWAQTRREVIDWDALIDTAAAWRLSLPVLAGLRRAEAELGSFCPDGVIDRLKKVRVNWRDRLALWHAPRDNAHLAMHTFVNVLTTPGLRFTLGYLRAVMLPGKAHMTEWYAGRHPGWLPIAYLVRCLWPVLGRVKRLWTRFQKVELRPSGVHGTGVFATRDLKEGELIARFHGRKVGRCGTYVTTMNDKKGRTAHYEITGRLRFLNHSCRPNARFDQFRLLALRPIRAGAELLIDYGPDACDCRRQDAAPIEAPIESNAKLRLDSIEKEAA